ncbi:MAG: sugar phosphate isomerase/epimerase [Chloroflexi bacterium]|nr:sugar phosphate isomerase/epimerase [Chloroflexota bacterium]
MTRWALGLDSYSLRLQGWDAFAFIRYASEMGLDAVHFSERANLASHDRSYLREVRDEARARGVALEVGLGSIDRHAASFDPTYGTAEEQVTALIQAAAEVGSPIVRCFLGDRRDRAGAVPLGAHIEECERVIAAVAPVVRAHGVRLALENHGGVDLLARELRAIIERRGFDVVGACLDTGNPAYAGEDPLLAAEVLASYALSTHVRDTAVWEAADGAMAQWVPLGEGNADLVGIRDLLVAQAPECPFDLEIITGSGPARVPYLTAAHAALYPHVAAADAARFACLARDGMRRGLGPRRQILAVRGAITPPDTLERLRIQQRADFESSVAYARNRLHLGQRAA